MEEPVWHAEWSASRVHWPNLFAPLAGKPNLRFLEIGVFEGGSAYWTLANVLTDPSSRLDLIDPIEFEEIAGEDQMTRLTRHLGPWLKTGQAKLWVGRSGDIVRAWPAEPVYDSIYIDGDHFPQGVLSDAVLAWPLLKPGGLFLFDDYVYELGGHAGPREAIDAFFRCYASEMTRAMPVGPDQYLMVKKP